jgi:hypothetical protein
MNSSGAQEGDGDTESNFNADQPHIFYHQQGLGNLRRCIVDISDSVFVVHAATGSNYENIYCF